jgi:urease accessory protein
VLPLPLLLLSDSRFPSGGYAHSGGLEAAVENGLAAADVPAYLGARLRAVAAPECALVLAAARATRAGDLGELLLLDDEAEARAPSAPLRTASRRLGSQLLRTAAVVWPGRELLDGYRAASDATPRAVAFGIVAAEAGLADEAAAQAYLYEDAASLATAAVRLLPVDAADALRWVVEAAGSIESLAREAVAVTWPRRRLPASFAPALELRSLAHERRQGRLFAS